MLDVLLPRHCLMCGSACEGGNLCPGCRGDLPRSGHCCRRCGLPLQQPADSVCGTCLLKPPPWNRVLAALEYRYPVDRLVQQFKFQRRLASGNILARELARAVTGSADPGHGPDVLVPVPLHRARLVSRTFNQSELLARHVGKVAGIRVDTRLLSRVRHTHAQSGLDARSRRRNTRGAFHCHYRRANGVRHAALVDDVMTTGATLSECCRELRRAGVGEISIWVAARAPPP